jgi:hypothetical protein
MLASDHSLTKQINCLRAVRSECEDPLVEAKGDEPRNDRKESAAPAGIGRE